MNTPHAPSLRAARRAPSTRPGARGFTLIELMIVLAVVSTLMSVAAPSMARLTDSVRMTSTANDLLSNLRLARSEGRKRGGRVVLCKSADGRQCAEAGGWEQGWIVFHDRNLNGEVDAGDPVLVVQPAVGGGLQVTGNRPVARAVAYSQFGLTRTVSGGMLAGTLTICKRSAEPGPARQLIFSSGGRVRVHQVELDHCG